MQLQTLQTCLLSSKHFQHCCFYFFFFFSPTTRSLIIQLLSFRKASNAVSSALEFCQVSQFVSGFRVISSCFLKCPSPTRTQRFFGSIHMAVLAEIGKKFHSNSLLDVRCPLLDFLMHLTSRDLDQMIFGAFHIFKCQVSLESEFYCRVRRRFKFLNNIFRIFVIFRKMSMTLRRRGIFHSHASIAIIL